MCLHPGSVNSEIGSNLFVVNLFKFFCCLKFVDNQAGAKTSLFLSR